MNDDFMRQFYEAPRAKFADALYERISKELQPRFAQKLVRNFTLRNAVVAFVFLLFVAACVYAVTEKRWNKVGGIWVDVQKTLTIEAGPPEMISEAELGVECLTVEEAQEIMRFDFQVPTWAPEGFTFDNKICGINIDTTSHASLLWQGPDEYSGIHIMLRNLRWFDMASQGYKVGPASALLPVAPRSYEEVEVNGQPAVLVHGSWNEPWKMGPPPEGTWELKWDKSRGLQLYWVEGEVLYYLNTLADVPAEDLIRMAESAR